MRHSTAQPAGPNSSTDHLLMLKLLGRASTVQFWCEVSSMDRLHLRFDHISSLALKLLTLPSSNATLERGFSMIKIVEGRLQNGVEVKLLNSVMTIRYRLLCNVRDTFIPF